MGEVTNRKRGRRGSPESWSVDGHVGQRLRLRRTLMGLSQEKLGEAIGLTFQQVQKYERGANRISAGTLYRLGQVLGVRVDYFFDEFENEDPHPLAGEIAAATPSPTGISRREAKLLRLWRAAPASVTEELLSLLSSIGRREEDEATSDEVAIPERSSDPDPDPRSALPTRGRRRHGAIWDPADIRSAGRSVAKRG